MSTSGYAAPRLHVATRDALTPAARSPLSGLLPVILLAVLAALWPSAPAQAASQTITFDDRAGQNQALNGQYPSGLIDWGTGQWWHAAPWKQLTTKSLSFSSGSRRSATFTLVSPRRLVSLKAYNGGSSSTTVTLSCPGQPNKQVVLNANTETTIATGWTGTCSSVTIANTNGWSTNFDDLVIDTGTEEAITGVVLSVQPRRVIVDPMPASVQIATGTAVTCIFTWGDGQSTSVSPVPPGPPIPTIFHRYQSPGVYTVRVACGNSISAGSDSEQVTILNEQITGLQASNNGPTQLGQPTTLRATVSSGTGIRYDWDFGDGTTASNAAPTLTHTYPRTGTFAARVTASNNDFPPMEATTSVTVVEPIAPVTGVVLSIQPRRVVGDPTPASVQIATGTAVTCVFAWGDGQSTSVSPVPPGSSIPPIYHRYQSPGVYTITVTCSNSISSASDSKQATVLNEQIIGLQASNNGPTQLGQPTTLRATVAGGTGIRYDWDFGDGSTALNGAPTLTHTYPRAGTFTAKVTASNNDFPPAEATTVVSVVDTIRPTITSVTPVHGATGVASDALVAGVASELLDVDSLWPANFVVACATPLSGTTGWVPALKQFSFSADSGLPAGAVCTATIKGGSGGVKDVAGNTLASDVTWSFSVAAATRPDLAVSISDSPDPVDMGQPVTLTVTVTNHGPGAALPSLHVAVASNATFMSAAGCSFSDGVVNCDLSTLSAGASITRSMVVTPTALGTMDTTARVFGAFEPNQRNNSATARTTVVQTVTFDDRAGQNQALSGQYPSGVIDWGTVEWWHAAPWKKLSTKSMSFNSATRRTATFTFLSPRRLVSLKAYNGGSSSTTVTLSCPGQANKEVMVNADSQTTIATGWTAACSSVTIANTNGWSTNFDDLVLEAPIEPITGVLLSLQSLRSLGDPTPAAVQIATGTFVTCTVSWGDGESETVFVVPGEFAPVPSHPYRSAGTYSVVARCSNPVSSGSDAKLARVLNHQILGLEVTNSGPTNLGHPTTLQATVAEGTGVIYDWTFGDGTSAANAGPTVTHTYAATGQFTAAVTARNEVSGTTAQTTVSVVN